VSAIAQIEAKLAKDEHARYVVEGSDDARTLTLQPADSNGFTLRLTERPGHWTVAYDGWHEEFDSEREALNCFAFGVSAACRLRVEYRGDTAVKWTVESLSNGAWVAHSTVGLLDPFFWRRHSVRYLQNHLIADDASATQG
jgi:hypothetical protein